MSLFDNAGDCVHNPPLKCHFSSFHSPSQHTVKRNEKKIPCLFLLSTNQCRDQRSSFLMSPLFIWSGHTPGTLRVICPIKVTLTWRTKISLLYNSYFGVSSLCAFEVCCKAVLWPPDSFVLQLRVFFFSFLFFPLPLHPLLSTWALWPLSPVPASRASNIHHPWHQSPETSPLQNASSNLFPISMSFSWASFRHLSQPPATYLHGKV